MIEVEVDMKRNLAITSSLKELMQHQHRIIIIVIKMLV